VQGSGEAAKAAGSVLARSLVSQKGGSSLTTPCLQVLIVSLMALHGASCNQKSAISRRPAAKVNLEKRGSAEPNTFAGFHVEKLCASSSTPSTWRSVMRRSRIDFFLDRCVYEHGEAL
jgi:hypothetical protein